MTNTDIQNKLEQYPESVKPSLNALRQLIYSLVIELELGAIEESVKWGEPSFKVKTGSPIRMDWKAATPDNYYLFFNCQTKLVDTFRELYGDVLEFQGNRAIVLNVDLSQAEQATVNTAVKHCIQLALTYQKVKHLPLLGA
ncbi:hypothetical protein GCM10008107_01000 [Psychrosphaera saromensis]|uniref:YdhG-like domain-containing protein n=1 Tax=Psychrosphaera saromensis TaxID=716813 RepID=A0A2S7UYR8_9GAMM|nr:DUF1801 domain-containing protein [Psychrosphaera saromensis]PQJ54929.1 hypothetical protein BTO11_15565 [Psychrosphaera saromensis]GHB56045.1 hypothetical protein GCM10008107_01000 [Psychrosphaera saromensis]GLQ13822.1 hypothetical protein GCM10007917_12770 [Psychrosphaera saromensis]